MENVPEHLRPRKKCLRCIHVKVCTRNNPVDCPDYQTADTPPEPDAPPKTKDRQFFGKAIVLGTLTGIGAFLLVTILMGVVGAMFDLDITETEKLTAGDMLLMFLMGGIPSISAGFVAGRLSKPYPLRNATITGCILNLPWLLPALLLPLVALAAAPSVLLAVFGGFLSTLRIHVER